MMTKSLKIIHGSAPLQIEGRSTIYSLQQDSSVVYVEWCNPEFETPMAMKESNTETVKGIFAAVADSVKQVIAMLSASVGPEPDVPEVSAQSDSLVRAQSAINIDVPAAKSGDTDDNSVFEEGDVRTSANNVDDDDEVAVASSDPSDGERAHEAPMLDGVEVEVVVTIYLPSGKEFSAPVVLVKVYVEDFLSHDGGV